MYIDQSVIDAAAAWIESHQLSDGSFENVGFLHHQELLGGLQGRDALTAYVAITAYALELAGSGLKHTAYDKLMATAQIDDNGALYWGGGGLPIEPYSEDRRTARHRNQSAAIETTGYALLALSHHEDLVSASRTAKWLVGQRNALGGFGSTQDTIVGLHGLTTFSTKVRTNADMTVVLESDTWRKDVRITPENADVLQTVQVPLGEVIAVTAVGECVVRRLYISFDRLSGEIPAELANLAHLEYLNLNGNQLSGMIPIELGKIPNLRSLDLSRNQLSGAIPAELGNLPNLEDLDLSDNQLGGEIPAELGNLPNLRLLFLQGNQLSGAIPIELGKIPNLSLDGNQLSGRIRRPNGTNPRYAWDGSTIRVSWDPVDGADYYKIYHDDFFDSSCSLRMGGSPSFCEELAANVVGTSYLHENPNSSENYYWVVACNSDGCSEVESRHPAAMLEASSTGSTNTATPRPPPCRRPRLLRPQCRRSSRRPMYGMPWTVRRYVSAGILWTARTTTKSTTMISPIPVVRWEETAARVSVRSWRPMSLERHLSTPAPQRPITTTGWSPATLADARRSILRTLQRPSNPSPPVRRASPMLSKDQRFVSRGKQCLEPTTTGSTMMISPIPLVR